MYHVIYSNCYCAGSTDGRKLVLSQDYRSVLWLAASSADLESISLVLDHFGCKCNDPVKTFNRFQYKVVTVHKVASNEYTYPTKLSKMFCQHAPVLVSSWTTLWLYLV